ncbi:MAG: transposase [Anaerolineaceae bacterium]|nr:transposase [Anaerolineaceae bacterium]
MSEYSLTMKLHLRPTKEDIDSFAELTLRYASACNFISAYVFNNGFILDYQKLQKHIYGDVRDNYDLKSQMTISALKTVCARYKTIETQLSKKPFRFTDEGGNKYSIDRTLDWLWEPVCFRRPQADLVRNRDYSFVENMSLLSINTLGKRVKVPFDVPEVFEKYFDGTWKFGTAKLVSLNNEWYLHISVSKEIEDTFENQNPVNIVGIDRGLRFLAVTYDQNGKTSFFSGDKVLKKRDSYNKTRAELQARGTKSAKRVLRRISGRENRMMADENHYLSKTLVNMFPPGTLFVIEDLEGVSFSEKNLNNRTSDGRNNLRSWAFYQLEQFLEYKAKANGSSVIKVSAKYTSQRCPVCGRILKENRKHETHEYRCDKCGYRSNDDRVGAMNIFELGRQFVSGNPVPCFSKPKQT